MTIKKILTMLAEESQRKAELASDITSASRQIIFHIFKLYYYGNKENNTTVSHWKNEIRDFLPMIPKLKGKNKFPKAEQIFHFAFDWIDDEFDRFARNFIKDLNAKYKDVFGQISYNNDDVEVLYRICKNYFIMLSDKLSKEGYVSIEDVINILGNFSLA